MLRFLICQHSHSNTNYRRVCVRAEKYFLSSIMFGYKILFRTLWGTKKKKGWENTVSWGFNPAWKAMKQQHCLHLAFLLVVIKHAKLWVLTLWKSAELYHVLWLAVPWPFSKLIFLWAREQPQRARWWSRKKQQAWLYCLRYLVGMKGTRRWSFPVSGRSKASENPRFKGWIIDVRENHREG